MQTLSSCALINRPLNTLRVSAGTNIYIDAMLNLSTNIIALLNFPVLYLV